MMISMREMYFRRRSLTCRDVVLVIVIVIDIVIFIVIDIDIDMS